MATQIQSVRSQMFPFLILIATATFSLSSQPGLAGVQRAPAALEQVSDAADFNAVPCDDDYYARAKNSKDGVTCTLRQKFSNDKTVNANVRVKVVPAQTASLGDVASDGHLEITISDWGTECKTCNNGVLYSNDEQPIMIKGSLGDLGHVAKFIDEKFADGAATVMKHQVAPAPATVEVARETGPYALSHERCQTDSAGIAYNAGQQMDCRIGHLETMNDYKARDYFHKNIEAEIREGLASNNAYMRSVALAAVNRLRSSPKFETLVKESLAQGFHQKEDMLITQIQSMNPNDPRRSALLSQLIQLNNSESQLGLGTSNPNLQTLVSSLSAQQRTFNNLALNNGFNNGWNNNFLNNLALNNGFNNGLNNFPNWQQANQFGPQQFYNPANNQWPQANNAFNPQFGMPNNGLNWYRPNLPIVPLSQGYNIAGNGVQNWGAPQYASWSGPQYASPLTTGSNIPSFYTGSGGLVGGTGVGNTYTGLIGASSAPAFAAWPSTVAYSVSPSLNLGGYNAGYSRNPAFVPFAR